MSSASFRCQQDGKQGSGFGIWGLWFRVFVFSLIGLPACLGFGQLGVDSSQ